MIESREVLLRCSACKSERSFHLHRAQIRQLLENSHLQYPCSYCSSPQYWEAARPLEMAEPVSAKAAPPRNILVVDDDDLTLRLLRKVLEAWDARIEVAQNGKEALSKLAAQEFDLMVCDIQMPEMAGPELFRHIQENAFLPPQRIIFLTGDKSLAVRQFLDSSGCYYLYKPLQFLEFSSQIQALLEGESVS